MLKVPSAHYLVCVPLWMQVYTSKQVAIGVVYTYPLTNRNFEICEALAATQGEPSIQNLLEDTAVSDEQHAANWEHVISFAKSMTPETVPVHNQFVGRFVDPSDLLLDSNAANSGVGALVAHRQQTIPLSAAAHSSNNGEVTQSSLCDCTNNTKSVWQHYS